VREDDSHLPAAAELRRHDEVLLAQREEAAAHDAASSVQPISEMMMVMAK